MPNIHSTYNVIKKKKERKDKPVLINNISKNNYIYHKNIFNQSCSKWYKRLKKNIPEKS